MNKNQTFVDIFCFDFNNQIVKQTKLLQLFILRLKFLFMWKLYAKLLKVFSRRLKLPSFVPFCLV